MPVDPTVQAAFEKLADDYAVKLADLQSLAALTQRLAAAGPGAYADYYATALRTYQDNKAAVLADYSAVEALVAANQTTVSPVDVSAISAAFQTHATASQSQFSDLMSKLASLATANGAYASAQVELQPQIDALTGKIVADGQLDAEDLVALNAAIAAAYP